MKTAWISPFVDSDSEIGRVGLSWFSQEMVGKLPVTVVAQKTAIQSENTVPVWSRGAFSAFHLLSFFLKNSEFKIIHLQHEVFAYGGFISAVAIPFTMLILRLLGRRIITTIHGVVGQSQIGAEFVNANGYVFPAFIVRLGFQIIYRLVGLASNQIIALDASMADILEKDYGIKNVLVGALPLPRRIMNDEFSMMNNGKGIINNQSTILNNKYSIINEFHVLFLGFAAGYKGLATFIEAASNSPEIKFTIASGPNPKLKNNPEYKKYYQGLESTAEKNRNVTWLGFVPDEDLPNLLNQASVLVLPYRYKLSSSGPLSWALSYDLPVAISEVYKSDFDSALIFGKTSADLEKWLDNFKNSEEFRTKVKTALDNLKKQRINDVLKLQQAYEKLSSAESEN